MLLYSNKAEQKTLSGILLGLFDGGHLQQPLV